MCLLVGATAPAAEIDPAVDLLGAALQRVGLSRDDLGFEPKGYWSRYPQPNRTPFVLPFFESLHAEPLRLYEFTRVMTDCVRANLSAEALDQPGTLYRLLFYLGIDHKVAQFRAYGVNLDPQVATNSPLLDAVGRAFDVAGQRMRIFVFNQKADWPDPEAEVKRATDAMDPELERIVAGLLLHIIDAYRWRQMALRNVDPGALRQVFNLRKAHGHSSDGQDYHFAVEDVARTLDEPSLYYAAQKVVVAAHDATRQLRKLMAQSPPDRYATLEVDFNTPLGRVRICGTGRDHHPDAAYAILIDLGGDDGYEGCVGASASLDVPFSVAIDLSGNDLYEGHTGGRPTQGAGLFGAGILIDCEGDDIYSAPQGAQGYGLFGVGVLADYGGNDEYVVGSSGQGSSIFGIGLCLDAAGDDLYYLLGDGQGSGGPGGVGILADRTGNDVYIAEPRANMTGRPDYHSAMQISVSQAQGCGAGVRADGTHGHPWAGGLGVLIDLDGNDRYDAGNFAIGCGYWYGIGILYDGGGDDTYRSDCYAIAGGCHFAIGALFDEGGNDRYTLRDTGDACIASGRDYQVALLFDRSGNDVYEGRSRSIAFAEWRSTALLIDLEGDDTYIYAEGKKPQPTCLASSLFIPAYRKPTYRDGPYGRYGNSTALLLDGGGRDQYIVRDFTTGAEKPAPDAGDQRIWFRPAQDSPDFGYRNFGIGWDIERGSVPEFAEDPNVQP